MQDVSPEAALRPPARERVHHYVRDGILRGRFAGGTFLEEEQVSLAVGVSRTPVREAFQQLQAERLIDLLPRRGAMVRPVTATELLEVYETRLMMESHAVRRISHARRPAPPALRPILAAMRHLPETSVFEHVQLNTEFHQAMVAGAGNSVLDGLYASLTTRQERVAVTSVSIDPGRFQIILAEHAALIEALDAHDAAAAIAILTDHLRPVHAILAQLPAVTESAE
jgi:DNA-binding GntR family transcriptional regulator